MLRASTRGLGKWGEHLTTQLKIEIENFWKDYVTKTKYISSSKNDKHYVLSMFPYPSGQLHMGHVRVYSISDSIARFHRMGGKDVIHPMGWDAFGLPAENAAINHGVVPHAWTKDNIAKMKEQLVNLGCNFDWDREINTSDPNYYKWTQAIFIELYNAGLVYKKEAYVNWDPVDQTVLADEQVDINGCSWRSGAKVEKRLLNQWFIKTTVFAKELYDGLNDPMLLDWKDIKQLQRHWIGECNGIKVDFNLTYETSPTYINSLTAWTDKPESLIDAQFILVPPSSILNKNDLITFEDEHFKKLSVLAENPITQKKLPIYIANNFSFAEGSDAHIGSPALNEDDVNFALAANIPLENKLNKSMHEIEKIRKMVCEMAQLKKVGGYPISSKLKDWLISRQRYWGTPIPIVNCDSCGVKPVPLEELPVLLPDTEKLNKSSQSWINTKCPSCGGEAKRETDTMDTFVDSSWYFLRYLDSKNKSSMFTKESAWKNMPVDVYIGGKEHAVLHLYYARFMNHFLHSIGKLPQKEPFKQLLVQGMVMGKSYRVKETGKYIPESKVKMVDDKKGLAVESDSGLPVEIDWEKMSKSKLNGVDPTEVLNEYGCDTTRLLMLADVSPMSHRNWSTETFPGVLNWQKRIWMTVNDFIYARSNGTDEIERNEIMNSEEFKKNEMKLTDSRNHFVMGTTFNYNFTHQLSVAISKMQGLTTALRRVPKPIMPLSGEFELCLATQILMLAPIIPHFASELWAGLLDAPNRINTCSNIINWEKDVLDQRWPIVDPTYKLDLMCVINGAECTRLKLLPHEVNALTSEKALDLVMSDKKVMKKIKKGIAEVDFKLYKNCRGYLSLTTKNFIPVQKDKCEAQN